MKNATLQNPADEAMQLRNDLDWQIYPLTLLRDRVDDLLEKAEDSADKRVAVTANDLNTITGTLRSVIANLEKLL